MMQPIPAIETQPELLFPVMGIDSSNEASVQPKDTARDGENVRTFDIFAHRGRGGSRPGLIRFIADQPIDGPLQSLAFVVYTTADATLQDDDGIGDGFGALGGGGLGGGGQGSGFGGPAGSGGGDGLDGGVGPFGQLGPGDDFVTDPSTSNKRRRRVLPPARYLIRRHGSGVPPSRNKENDNSKQKKKPPKAVDDRFFCNQGDSLNSMAIIANDTYNGVPNVTLGVVPSLDGGTFGLSGTGSAVLGFFTAGTTATTEKTYVIPYRLTASANAGSAMANIIIKVSLPFPPPTYPVIYTTQVNSVTLGDGFADFTIFPGSGLPAVLYHITANGPGSGEPGATNIFVLSFSQFSGIAANSNCRVTLTGTNPEGFDGQFELI